MNESILFPSPNWFQVSGIAVTTDGWVIYGGPSKSICVLQPLPEGSCIIQGSQGYKTHSFNKPQPEKIVSVDVSPEWPQKKCFLAGSSDGTVKQWILEEESDTYNIKSTHSHEIHNHDKEEIVGVAYSNETYAVTVGGFGNVVKWDLNSNVVKQYGMLKNFRPVCMSCSPHSLLHVAIGTKQGVVFVLDLNGTAGKIVYKVRGQDDEIVSMSWCPEYQVTVLKKTGPEVAIEERKQSKRMDKIRESAVQQTIEIDQSAITKDSSNSSVLQENTEAAPELTNQNEKQLEEVKQVPADQSKSDLDKSHLNKELPNDSFVLEKSGVSKDLPDDSFNETEVVEEDDMFDIYTDHAADEFGHKKYQPEVIKVKIKEEKVENEDYLAECLKLKEEILKNKNAPESSIQSLVEALDNTHVDNKENNDTNIQKLEPVKNNDTLECSDHTHKHLLATVGKYSGIRIWSKQGKLVGSCAIPTPYANKNQRGKPPSCATVLWYKASVLLIADGKSQLLECNPLVIDSKNKLEWEIVHSYHNRGLFSITSNAPRVQSQHADDTDWFVLTAAQDRKLLQYSLKDRRLMATHATVGGLLYMIQPCPYDVRKVAISVGDGAVRVWKSDTCPEDETKLVNVSMSMFWQNVQGRVLAVAWHPTKENLLAFSTRESRVGLIDASKRSEKPARTFVSGLRGGVYGLCWGENDDLYACASGDLVRYDATNVHNPPTPIKVEVEGLRWEVSSVRWTPDALLVGSDSGAVAALAPSHPYQPLAVTFVFSKMIHTTERHPIQTSNSTDESPYKNLIAVCSLDKQNTVVILEYGDKEDGGKKLSTWKTLHGHTGKVLQLAWSPHQDELILSTSDDWTTRVWDVVAGTCVYVLGSTGASISGAWLTRPHAPGRVLSAGSDFTLRLWHAPDHPAHHYTETKATILKREKKTKKQALPSTDQGTNEEKVGNPDPEMQIASSIESKKKICKKFLLPLITKQMSQLTASGAKKMLEKYLLSKSSGEKTEKIKSDTEVNYDMEWMKIFGTINEVNEALDTEMEHHQDTGHTDSWMILSIFRGQIDSMIQYANKKDIICPYLLSITPCVSFKYWKDATQLYLAQIERLKNKGEEQKLSESRQYGGAVYRWAATQLSLHDVKAAVAYLVQARLYKDAYVLCRIRYMDSIAEQTLQQWAADSTLSGQWIMGAVCYIALGNISQAAAVLGKSNDEESLSLAAELAKLAGQNTFAEHMTQKALLQSNKVQNNTEEVLEQLPSRIELLMKETDKTDDIKIDEAIDVKAVETVQIKTGETLDIESNNIDKAEEAVEINN